MDVLRPATGSNAELAALKAERDRLDARIRALEAGTSAAPNHPLALVELYRDLVDQTSEGVWVVDALGRTTFTNAALRRMLACDAVDFGRRRIEDFVFPEDLAAFHALLARRRDGINETHEFRFRRDDGGAVWTLVNANAILDAAGGYVGALAMVTDVTGSKQAALALQREQLLLGRIVESTPALIAYHDARLAYRWVNPEFERLLGVSSAALMGVNVFEAFSGAEAAFGVALAHVRAHLETYQDRNVPLLQVREGVAVTTHWDLSFVPVLDDRGALEGILGFGVEVSDRYEKERLQQAQIDALKRTDEIKEQFLGVISHELRTPLHVLLGYLTLMQKEWAGPITDQQREHLTTMRQTVDLLTRLVNDLLDMSQIQAGAFSVDVEVIELMPVVADVLERIAPLATNKRLALRTRLPAEGQTIRGDERRLSQVLLNLLNNAVKFTPEGGQITLTVQVGPEAMRFEVADTGIGIAEDNLAKLFRRFSQVDMSATRRANGTGLGLSIAKAIVEAHGGAIGVTSQRGAGSTFWFTLPLGDNFR
jgi:PAS domain S-box-containing protein